MGDRVEYLRAAVAAIPDVVAVSDAYETDPVGGWSRTPSSMWSNSTPPVLPTSFLRWSQRERDAERLNDPLCPRTLDVDVLWVDGETVDDPPELLVLGIRNVRALFVLVPLADLAPDVARRPRRRRSGDGRRRSQRRLAEEQWHCARRCSGDVPAGRSLSRRRSTTSSTGCDRHGRGGRRRCR